tara:strand:+ start:183 stop:968 length:786 start_codon:yes stop_codon:yes gene_type:complete
LTSYNRYIKINKNTWNVRTPIHIKSKFYNQANFKNGTTSLKNIEINALGDIKSKKLLHLQCHFGQDSISLARMGAKVTGVDFSDVAILEAKKIAKEIDVNINFIESNVLDLRLNKQFDIIFSSYGVLGWLPNLQKWAKTINLHLKKGGLFLLTEFHPLLEIIKDNGYDYFYNPHPDIEFKNGTYTDGGENIKTTTCWWNHSLSDIFFALESNGLKLLEFKEFDYSPFKLENMTEKDKGKYVLKKRLTLSTPYIFNLKATKK